MTTINFKNENIIASKDLVSRKNQDGTVIVMKLDDNNLFFKLSGLSAAIWNLVQTPNTFQTISNTLKAKYPDVATVEVDLTSFLQNLCKFELIQSTTEQIPNDKEFYCIQILTEFNHIYSTLEIKSFNLEQIEQEVLNNSIYLDVFAGSDLRLKNNIKNIEHSLSKVCTLDGIHFDWNEKAMTEGARNSEMPKTGLIAQQVAEVFPELVKKDAATQNLTVNYTQLIPHLVESIKDLKSQIEVLRQEIKILKH